MVKTKKKSTQKKSIEKSIKKLSAEKLSTEKLSTESSQNISPSTIHFKDFPDFLPNLSPSDVLHLGSFGGTYFRDITSSVTGKKYKDTWKELPSEWMSGLDIESQVSSDIYNPQVNYYGVKCGSDLDMWESKGWIKSVDPYGWFQWYCRFYQGRRTEDDTRQIQRWKNFAGEKGRFKRNIIRKIQDKNGEYDDYSISPVIRQGLQHRGYQLTESDVK